MKKYGYLEKSYELMEKDPKYGWVESSVEEILEDEDVKLDTKEVLKLLTELVEKEADIDLNRPIKENLLDYLEVLEDYNYKEDLVGTLKRIGVELYKITEDDFEHC